MFGLKIALGTDLRIFQCEQKSGVNFFYGFCVRKWTRFWFPCILQTLNSAGNHFRVVFNPKQPYKKFSPDSALRNTYLAPGCKGQRSVADRSRIDHGSIADRSTEWHRKSYYCPQPFHVYHSSRVYHKIFGDEIHYDIIDRLLVYRPQPFHVEHSPRVYHMI